MQTMIHNNLIFASNQCKIAYIIDHLQNHNWSYCRSWCWVGHWQFGDGLLAAWCYIGDYCGPGQLQADKSLLILWGQFSKTSMTQGQFGKDTPSPLRSDMVDGDASAFKKIIVQKPRVSVQFRARHSVEQQVRTGVLRGLYYIWIVGLCTQPSPVCPFFQSIFPSKIWMFSSTVKWRWRAQ